MSDRDTAASRRYSGGAGYDWRRGSSNGTFTYVPGNTTGSGSQYETGDDGIRRRDQDQHFMPVALYTDFSQTGPGMQWSSPRPVIQDKATAIARWDAPPGSPDALPEWLREQVRQMAYAYQGRKVPDSWVRGFWEKTIAGAAELGTDATALQSMYTKVLQEEEGGGSGSSYYSGGGGGYGGGGGGGGSVSLTNPTSARGLLMQTMQGVLGRNPTNDEYKTFLQVLNEAEMANPNTASFEGGVAVGSGGVDPSVLALEFAQDQEDYTERQGDRYFRTFMQALAGGV